MKNCFWTIIGRVLRILLPAIIMLVLAQDILIFPGMVRGKLSCSGDKDSVPDQVEQLFVTTSDQEQVEVWRLGADEQVEKERTVAIIFHGNGGPLPVFYAIQLWFQQMGITSYAFDYRGFGRSTGWPSEEGIYLDSEAVWNLVTERERIPPRQIIVFGLSIGSGPAARLAAEHNVGTLLLLAPYSSLPDVAKERPPLGWLRAFMWYTFPTTRYVSQLTDTCLVIVHGSKDRIIPPWVSEDLETAYRGNVQVSRVLLPQTFHNDLFFKARSLLEEKIAQCP